MGSNDGEAGDIGAIIKGPMDLGSKLDSLSARERQVLDLAAQGLTDSAIVAQLGISIGTINTYWGRIRFKIGPLSRAQLVTEVAMERARQELAALRDENSQLIAVLVRSKHVENRLRQTLKWTTAMLAGIGDAFLVVDRAGVICSANAVAEQLLERPSGTLVGTHVRDLVPQRYHGLHSVWRDMFLHSPDPPRPMGSGGVVAARTGSGGEVTLAITMNAIETDTGPMVVCLARRTSFDADPLDRHMEPAGEACSPDAGSGNPP